MSNLASLRTAKAQLGISLPDEFLRAVANLPESPSDYKIRSASKEKGLLPNAQEVRDLQLIIKTASESKEVQPINQIDAVDSTLAQDHDSSFASQATDQFNTNSVSAEDLTEISFADDVELTLSSLDPISPVSQSKKTESGTDGNFEGYYIIDLPEEDIDDIQLKVQNSLITLEWAKKNGGYSYVVVGSPNDFPADVRHGEYRWLTKENTLAVSAEICRFFTVFAFKDKGAKGTQIAQGLMVDDIVELEAEAYENEVRLRWVKKSPDGVVKVARSAPNQNLPKPLTFSNYLPVPPNALAFTDVNVNSGDTYEYRVFVEWKGPGGQIFETPGARITETTPSKVPQVDNFTVLKNTPDTVEITYNPVSRGEVRVYQLRGLPSAELTAAKVSRAEFDVSMLDAGEYKWLGTRIIGSPERISSKVVIHAPMLPGQKDSRTYVAISVLGAKALISDVKVVQQVGDIEELKVIDRYDYVLLRVSPPAGANALDVWVLNENAEIGLANPTRRVQIDDEYRRFGGIIFADDIKGLDKARALDREPKKIVVRGVSSWDGEDHLGTPSDVIYPGRLEVHYRSIRIGALSQKGYLPWYAYIFPWIRKRYLKKAAEELNTDDIAKFEVKIVGNRNTRQSSSIKANHFVGTHFPIDKDDQSIKDVKQFEMTFKDENIGWLMENKIGEFEVDLTQSEAEKMVGNSTKAKSARAKKRSRDSRGRFKSESEKFTLYNGTHFHRLVAIPDPSISETVFSIDETQYPVVSSPAVDANLKVVIMGPKRSGKTTYVQALVNYLSNQLSVQMRSRMIAKDDDEYTLKKMQEMESFVTHGALPQATQSASPFASGSGPLNLNDPRKPMTFVFENGESVPIRNLQLTDVAGEDMDKLETMKLYADSIAEADLLIFLVDPLQIKQVRVALAGKPMPEESGSDPFSVLLNLAKLMSEIRGQLNPKQKFAIVISKFDGIEDLAATSDNPMSGTITPGLAVTRDPMTNSQATSTNLADLQDNIRVNNEALAILERLRAGDFVTLAKNKLPLAQYFVVSALGHSSYNDRMDSAGISSFRISDPIRWAVATGQVAAPVAEQVRVDPLEPAQEIQQITTVPPSVILPSPPREDIVLSSENEEVIPQSQDIEEVASSSDEDYSASESDEVLVDEEILEDVTEVEETQDEVSTIEESGDFLPVDEDSDEALSQLDEAVDPAADLIEKPAESAPKRRESKRKPKNELPE